MHVLSKLHSRYELHSYFGLLTTKYMQYLLYLNHLLIALIHKLEWFLVKSPSKLLFHQSFVILVKVFELILELHHLSVQLLSHSFELIQVIRGYDQLAQYLGRFRLGEKYDQCETFRRIYQWYPA